MPSTKPASSPGPAGPDFDPRSAGRPDRAPPRRTLSPLRARAKTLLGLIVAQAGCLAAGLWIHDRYLVAVERMQAGAAAEAATWLARHSEMLVNVVVFVWIAVLQAIVAWLFLTRLRGVHEQREKESREETLVHARELVRTRDAVIFGLAKLAESRDPESGHHLERIALYSTRLATALRRHPKYRHIVNSSFVKTIGISSVLHDIGKVGVEDAILLKPGPLTADERKHIQEHAAFSAECIRQIQRRIGDSGFLEMARQIALYHHEWWDGTGYPTGLRGDQIPLPARIVALADVYDALSVRRVYKEAFPHEVCVKTIRDECGRHFDPDLVDVFLSLEAKFREIALRFAEQHSSPRGAAQPRQEQFKRALELGITEEQEEMLLETLRSLAPPDFPEGGPAGPDRPPRLLQPAATGLEDQSL
ncbi:MAG: HD domain-containing protein [Planctomycetia bacterium]|nr:HD domain-containing protein [Planctomycetia bacterium]